VDKLNQYLCIKYNKAIPNDQLLERVMTSDILLHIESFRKKFKAKTLRALSTKIPDYLASGKLILAIGPSGIESIEYLRKNKAAYIISDIDKIYVSILNLIKNYETYGELIV